MKKNPQIEGDTPEAAAERVKNLKESMLCYFWEPYPWQERFLKMVREKATTAAVASNKVGKCLTYQTLIDTPNGKMSIGSLYEAGKPFEVFSWDGEKKIVAKAEAPFKKPGLHQCYEIEMDDGQKIGAADNHKILTVDNGFVPVYELRRRFFPSPPETSLDSAPSVHGASGRHLKGKEKGFQCGRHQSFYSNDEQPLYSRDTFRASVPSQGGFSRHNPSWLTKDGQEGRCTRSRLSRCIFPPYTQRRFLGRLFESLYRTACTSVQPLFCARQGFPQPCVAGAFLPRQVPKADLRTRDTLQSAYSPPLMVDGNKIVAFNKVGVKEVFDFTVPGYHNYIAGGMVHHNSAAAVNLLISWALGFEPWTMAVDKKDDDWIKVGGYWFRESSLGIKPPVDLILTGEDWKLHIGRVLVPELKKWAPQGRYTTKKNEQGTEYFWQWDNKSTLTIMSYSQDDDLFESFRAQGVVMDEPPPKSKYSAMSRGLLLDLGKTVLSLTPLKEAWILDDIVLSERKDVGIIDNLKITDNPDLYNQDIETLRGYGLYDSQIEEFFDLLLYENKDKGLPVNDCGKAAERFLDELSIDGSKVKILKFVKDIDPSDVPPRVFGQFKHLVGRVLKDFDRNIHIIKPFDVPTDWPVTVMIDFHLSTPQAISYWGVNRQDVKYCIGETWKNLSADEIADDIIRHANKDSWRIEKAYIDPLSKGDTSYMRNQLGTNIRDTFSIIYEKLSQNGIDLAVASKDKESGIKNIQGWLKGVNGLPTCYIFETCERHLYEVQRWVFDENQKPAKDGYDHMMENFYRYSLTGARYEDFVINPLPTPTRRMTAGAWMGA